MIEARDLAAGFGVAMALEGALWAGAPEFMRRILSEVAQAGDAALRYTALAACAAGVAIVWAASAVS